MIKTYRILVSFGDGRPVHSTIDAKHGHQAHDLAFAAHPGARRIHVLGVDSVREEAKPVLSSKPEPMIHPLFTDTTMEQVHYFVNAGKDDKIKECLKLRNSGMTHQGIANILNVGKTTVGDWIKRYG
jgi:hypothetical protein